MDKQEDLIHQLQETIRLLKLENEALSERSEGTLSLRNDLRELNSQPGREVDERTQEFVQADQLLQREITERQQAVSALRESEERLRKAQTIAHVGNWELDLATRVMWGSEEAFDVYGLERTSPELPLALIQSCVLPEYRPAMDQALQRLISGTGEYDVEFQIRTIKEGKKRSIHSRAELIVDETGKPVKVLGAIQDITERKQAEEETKRRLAELEAVNRISTALRVAQSFDEMLPGLLDETLAVLGADTGSILLYHPEDGWLHPAKARGWLLQISEPTIKPGDGIVGHVYATGEVYLARDFSSDPLTRDGFSPDPAGVGWRSDPYSHSRRSGRGAARSSAAAPRAAAG